MGFCSPLFITETHFIDLINGRVGASKGNTDIPESLSVKRAVFTDKLSSNEGLSVKKRFSADKLAIDEGLSVKRGVFTDN